MISAGTRDIVEMYANLAYKISTPTTHIFKAWKVNSRKIQVKAGEARTDWFQLQCMFFFMFLILICVCILSALHPHNYLLSPNSPRLMFLFVDCATVNKVYLSDLEQYLYHIHPDALSSWPFVVGITTNGEL